MKQVRSFLVSRFAPFFSVDFGPRTPNTELFATPRLFDSQAPRLSVTLRLLDSQTPRLSVTLTVCDPARFYRRQDGAWDAPYAAKAIKAAISPIFRLDTL